jgi:hypothetical protein
MSHRPMRIDPMARVAEPAAILNRLGLTTPILAKIGAIAILTSSIEHRTEMTVRALNEYNAAGQRHCMNGCPSGIGDWIKALAEVGSALQPGNLKMLMALWCQAAETALTCWNRIVHACIPSTGSEATSALKLPRRQTEIRKRALLTSRVDEHCLALMEQVFAVLYRVLLTIEGAVRQRHMDIAENTVRTLLTALREACVTCREVEGTASEPHHEQS